jgi:hypothetical protein
MLGARCTKHPGTPFTITYRETATFPLTSGPGPITASSHEAVVDGCPISNATSWPSRPCHVRPVSCRPFDAESDAESVRAAAQVMLEERFHISHVTLQIERGDFRTRRPHHGLH